MYRLRDNTENPKDKTCQNIKEIQRYSTGEREVIINIVVVITNAKPMLVNKLAIPICETITRMEEMEKGIII